MSPAHKVRSLLISRRSVSISFRRMHHIFKRQDAVLAALWRQTGRIEEVPKEEHACDGFAARSTHLAGALRFIGMRLVLKGSI
jgi:hypothetical protein